MATAAASTSPFASRVEGLNPAVEHVDTSNNANTTAASSSVDPFASQRTADNNPFAESDDAGNSSMLSPPSASTTQRDRRLSKEWDASKVPPSRFQKPEGSLYATPSSRDGHIGKNKQHAFTEKLKEKGWL